MALKPYIKCLTSHLRRQNAPNVRIYRSNGQRTSRAAVAGHAYTSPRNASLYARTSGSPATSTHGQTTTQNSAANSLEWRLDTAIRRRKNPTVRCARQRATYPWKAIVPGTGQCAEYPRQISHRFFPTKENYNDQDGNCTTSRWRMRRTPPSQPSLACQPLAWLQRNNR